MVAVPAIKQLTLKMYNVFRHIYSGLRAAARSSRCACRVTWSVMR
jgi:hypothetical protein